MQQQLQFVRKARVALPACHEKEIFLETTTRNSGLLWSDKAWLHEWSKCKQVLHSTQFWELWCGVRSWSKVRPCAERTWVGMERPMDRSLDFIWRWWRSREILKSEVLLRWIPQKLVEPGGPLNWQSLGRDHWDCMAGGQVETTVLAELGGATGADRTRWRPQRETTRRWIVWAQDWCCESGCRGKGMGQLDKGLKS